MPKDRTPRRFLASDVQLVVERSSEHPIEYAIMLLALRDGRWRTVRTFDNAHDPSEHHEHAYVGLYSSRGALGGEDATPCAPHAAARGDIDRRASSSMSITSYDMSRSDLPLGSVM